MDPVGDFARHNHAPERALPLHRALVPIAGVDAGLHLFREDITRHDRVDPNAAAAEVRCENRGQMADRRLRNRIPVHAIQIPSHVCLTSSSASNSAGVPSHRMRPLPSTYTRSAIRAANG